MRGGTKKPSKPEIWVTCARNVSDSQIILLLGPGQEMFLSGIYFSRDESKKENRSRCFTLREFNLRSGVLSEWPEMMEKGKRCGGHTFAAPADPLSQLYHRERQQKEGGSKVTVQLCSLSEEG